jgi:hypothetical protein
MAILAMMGYGQDARATGGVKKSTVSRKGAKIAKAAKGNCAVSFAPLRLGVLA